MLVIPRRMLRHAPFCKTSFAGHVRTLSSRLSATILQRKNATQRDVLSLVSHVDITWNSFLPYLVSLTDSLESLDLQCAYSVRQPHART